MRKGTVNDFYHTELGVLPVEWKIRSIRELQLDISDGNYSSKYPRADEFKSIGVPFIRANNIKGLTITDDDMRFISETKHSEITKGHLKDGDVLITNRGDIGNLAIVPARHIGSNINAQIVRINTSGSEVSNRYFAYYLQKDEVKKLLSDLSSGSALKQLPVNRLTTLKVIVPTPQEQTAIADALSDVDALICEQEKLIAKKQAIKTAAMQQLLTGRTRLPQFASRDDGTPKGTKLSELGKIPEDWDVCKIGDFAPLQRGFDLPSSNRVDGQFPVVYSNGIVNTHCHFQVRGPGVVTGRSGTLGKVHYIEDDYWPHNTSLWVTKFNGTNPKFIYFVFAYIGFERFASGSGVPTLNRNDAHSYRVAVPSTETEQAAIATTLSDMDAEIKLLEQSLNKTRQIRQGMMQELLTGKTRLIQGSEAR